MQPATINITIYKGSTYSKEIQWLSGEPPVPVDLTGCTARMQLKASAFDSTNLDQLSTENGRIQIYDPTQGKLRIKFPANVSSQYNFNTALYDLEIVFQSEENVYRIAKGTITTDPEITR
jgi:hypothetical protein